MIKDIIYIFIGAFLGYYLPIIIPIIKKKRLDLLTLKKNMILNPNRLYSWLLKYYHNKGTTKDLYHFEFESKIIIIPFLTAKSFLFFKELNIENEEHIIFLGKATDFPINQRLIKKKQRFSQVLFNEPTLFVESIVFDNGVFKITSKECLYFELITSISELEEETSKAIKKNKIFNLKTRDNYLSSLNKAMMPRMSPFSLGAVVLLAFRTTSGFEVLLHKRSMSTATFGGYKSVIPSYGLTTCKKNDDYEISISFYNFIKELAEELFDYEDLIQQMRSKRGDQYWFLETEDIKEIFNSFSTKLSRFLYTGFGIDTVNGTNTLSYLVIFNDLSLSRKIRRKIKGNWEVDTSDTYSNLEFYDIKDPKLIMELEDSNFHFGSAFCLARGLEYLNHEISSIKNL